MPPAPQTVPISQNRLLAALPPEELARLAPRFQRVPLVFKDTLFEAGARIEYLYFPLDGVISTIASTENGSSVEVGIVGKEGTTDVSAVLGDDISSHRGIVQLPGSALKLSAAALREELRRDGGLRSVLLRYTRFTLAQATQSAACNRLHSVEQRCARWLLSMRDRVEVRHVSDHSRILGLHAGRAACRRDGRSPNSPTSRVGPLRSRPADDPRW